MFKYFSILMLVIAALRKWVVLQVMGGQGSGSDMFEHFKTLMRVMATLEPLLFYR